jgi:hypothetical protein
MPIETPLAPLSAPRNFDPSLVSRPQFRLNLDPRKRFPNRHWMRLEIAATSTKQTEGPSSNRHKNRYYTQSKLLPISPCAGGEMAKPETH